MGGDGGQTDGARRTTRRRFLDGFLGTSAVAVAAAALYPVVRFLSPPRVAEATTFRVEAGPVNDPELMTAEFKILPFGREPVILIRVADDDFRAFSAVCTHLECIVTFRTAGRAAGYRRGEEEKGVDG